jgi:hypothetical protein
VTEPKRMGRPPKPESERHTGEATMTPPSELELLMQLNAWRAALIGLCQGPSETMDTPEKAADNVRRRLRDARRGSAELSADEYQARAIPRLAAIDALAAKIDFSSFAWENTHEGERFRRLMAEQGRDEEAAGL